MPASGATCRSAFPYRKKDRVTLPFGEDDTILSTLKLLEAFQRFLVVIV